MAIIRLQIPEAITQTGPIRDFFFEAAAASHYPHVEQALDFLASEISSPGCGVWLGAEDHQLKAACVAFYPGNPLMIAPQVCVAYNTGSRELSREIGEAVVEWCREGGFDHLRALNETGYSDTAHMRAFRYVGAGHLVASLIEYRFKPDGSVNEQPNGRVEAIE